MSVIYIVQGLGFGDNSEEFYSICAVTTRKDAERWVADAKVQDAIDFEDSDRDADFEYRIVEVPFNVTHAEFNA